MNPGSVCPDGGEAAHEQQAGDQQYGRQADLDGDQRLPREAAARRRPHPAGREFPQQVRLPAAGGEVGRGRQPEDRAGDRDRGEGEGQHRARDPDLDDPGDPARVGGEQRPDPGPRQQDASGAAEPGEDQPFGDERPHGRGAAGAERGAQREVAAARLGASQDEVREVGAGGEQQEPGEREEREQPVPVIAGDVLVEVEQDHRVELGIGRVGVQGLRSPAFEQRGQLGAGRVERDAVREPGDHRVVVGGAAGEVGEVEGERDPELDPEVEEIHPGRQYPHHRPPDPVHRDPGAEDLGVGAEGAPPDPVREEDDRLRAGSVFRAREDPPPGSGDPQGAKEARGNRSDLAAKRRPAGLYRRRSRVEDPGLGERRAPLAVFEVFRSGDPEPVETHAGELGRDPHQLVRGAVGQGGEQGPVDHGEDRRVHSDPERDHQKRGRRVTGVLQEGAESASHLGKRPCPAEPGGARRRKARQRRPSLGPV